MDRRVEAVAVETMPEWMQDVVAGVADEVDEAHKVKVRHLLGSSNDTLEMIFDTDRILMVKRSQHDWMQQMFDTAEAASELLRAGTDLAAPNPLPIDRSSSTGPLQAYWRIPLPTLGDLWPELSKDEREESLRSLGRVLRSLHRVELPGWGDLVALDKGPRGLEDYLNRDLGDRLLPAVYAKWSPGVTPLRSLIDAIPAVAGRVDSTGGVLSHSDVHIDNVLCRDVDGQVQCVGLLDLDNARSLPPEADLASFQILHGPLFNQELERRKIEAVIEGYGGHPDPVLLRFYRASHLANLGFHSGLVGDDLHAGWVADALTAEVEALHQAIDEPSPDGVAGILP